MIYKKDALCVRNISGGGVCLCLPEKLKSGTKLYMDIRLVGNREVLTARGEVAWLEESPREEEARYKNDKTKPKQCYETGIMWTEIDHLSVSKVYTYFREHNLQINLS